MDRSLFTRLEPIFGLGTKMSGGIYLPVVVVGENDEITRSEDIFLHGLNLYC